MSYAAAQPYHPRPYGYEYEVRPPLNPNPISSSPAYPPTTAVVTDSPVFSHPYYLHHHHHPNSLPPTSIVHANPEQQKIHTLFVSGLPDDVKAREIHNLFRRRHGFDSCQLKYTGRGDQVVAFATFVNHQSAMAVMSELNGVIFDPQTGATLHIELARSNSRKRPRGDEAYAIIDERVKVTNGDQGTWSNDGDGGSDEPSGTENDNSGSKDALGVTQSAETIVTKENTQAASNDSNDQSEKPLPADIPLCSTLFIANLSPTCTEEELKKALSTYSGFHTLKMRGKSGLPVAFADFTDVESSTAAMNGLQEALLGSSDRGGIVLEYARSKMRKS